MNAKELIKEVYKKKGFISIEWFAEKFNISKEHAAEILDFGVSLEVFYITLDKQRWDLKEYALHEIISEPSIKEFQEFLDKHFKVVLSVQPEIFFEEKRDGSTGTFVPKRLGDFIMDKFSFKTIKGNDRQIYYYHQGYFKDNGIALIKSQATSLLKSLFKDHHIIEVLSYIRNSSYIDADEINHEWINLKNGLLNPTTKEFKEHTPDIFTLKQLPINYDPEADCPFFKDKLKEKCDEEWKFDLIQEMFGYTLLKDQRFEKAFLLYGDPRTMKSTTLYVLAQLLGEENITAMSLQYLTEDRHGAAFLYGNPANICADLSSKELVTTAMFMKVVGQDSITAGKKYEQEITFSPFTKLIFSCNTIPATRNKNLAFYRRWCVIEFNMQTSEKEIDPLMREKLVKELSGILNWALEGLKKILEKNKLSYPLSDEDTKDLYEKASDSIQSFIYHEIDCENDEGAIKKRDVYKSYKKYCKENRLNLDNQIIFGRRFFAITGCGMKRLGSIPAYAGVSFKGENHSRDIIDKQEDYNEKPESQEKPQNTKKQSQREL